MIEIVKHFVDKIPPQDVAMVAIVCVLVWILWKVIMKVFAVVENNTRVMTKLETTVEKQGTQTQNALDKIERLVDRIVHHNDNNRM